ncbi:uncharacterized protein LOC111678362 [Lucilia cuprina]|uniref:uncharacterized protein LOC111678362 n=1 Tax=Lucilia cuprina TaxID=7375 RepID=UPI001F070E59|nr:uncharacterized protein LOC111678362 [Lucilia cuprina]
MSTTCCGLKLLIAIIVFVTYESGNKHTCNAFEVYFPMSAIQLNLPLNEKSQSIFSKIPIGQFQVLAVSNNSVATDYVYSLENNDLLNINSTTGEVFIRNDYKLIQDKAKYILTALSKSTEDVTKIPHMSLELKPLSEQKYCANMENICFWSSAHYTILEDVNVATKEDQQNFKPIQIGSLNPRAAKYLCPYMNITYNLLNASDLFILKNNLLFTRAPLDYELLNSTHQTNLTVTVSCRVEVEEKKFKEFRKNINIQIVDRNDNGPELQDKKIYNFYLDNPHFKENDTIGEKIIFVDKDSMETNAHQTYQILDDINDLVRPLCNAYEADHTGKRNSIISCQIVFARNGILSQSPYCFILEATDKTIDVHVPNTAKAHICIKSDPNKIHEADRPKALALRSRQHRKSNVMNSEESILNSDGFGRTITRSILSTYPKDAYVYRTAQAMYRVTQPKDFLELMKMPELKYTIVEDRSKAFAITSVAGIIYVKNTTALENAPEIVYFLNVSWHDTHQRSFVINVHLVNGRPDNTTCDHKVKSRSQTCAQIKYASQCVRFCGLATNGSSCVWRGSSAGFFGRNYKSCVPNPEFCPDNICDPLEELNTAACPQDCTPSNKIMGPHSTNENRRGILSASGTCTCEDNGKCSCAPLDDEEPKPKRKRKNDTRSENSADKLEGPIYNLNTQKTDKGPLEEMLNLAGWECDNTCIIVAITCPMIFITLIICLILTKRSFKKRSFSKESVTNKKKDHLSDCDVKNGDLPLMQLENSFKFDSSIADTKWEFPRESLVLDCILGEGEFGKVMKGYATDIAQRPGVTTVAVKMLKKGANSVEYMALVSEFQLLQEVSHPNVIKLLGACTKGDAPMIIIEYARYGSLRSYLRLSRKIESAGCEFADGVEPVTVRNILSFALQICKGMTYLTEIKLVHRDLAARNVLLAEGKICKISDFGLTRDVYEDDAYLKRSRDRVPVKWMAPESLADHVYTTKSDVWAFGVLCWELITLGASPYPGIPPQNLYHLLKNGYRMEKPENCSDEIYNLVKSCWTDEPNARPSFKYLASEFEKLLGNNAKYIELETNAFSNPNYCLEEEITKEASNIEETDLSKPTNLQWGEPDPLDHLWRPPKISYDLQDCCNSRDTTNTFSSSFQPPPGYDMPRPLLETHTIEQRLRYENDLRFPLNIRKTSMAEPMNNIQATYTLPVKRGRSYMDMTNKTLLCDNLDNDDFEKHISKTISFRFSSLLNLNEQEDSMA